MSEFARALSLTTVEGAAGQYTAEFTDDWIIGAAVNGGIVQAVALAALRAQVGVDGGHGDPLVASAFFLSAATPGPASVRTEVLRRGRSMSTGQASVVQVEGGVAVERMRVLATFGDLSVQSVPVVKASAPPDLPEPDACLTASREAAPGGKHIAILDRLDLRLDPATSGWAWGEPSGAGELRAWIRFADGTEPDLSSLPFFVDAMPPVTFDLGAAGWAPTLELTSHVRAVPAPGWLRVRATTANVAGGLLEEDVVIWDSTDRVVAQSRQLAGVRMPSAGDRS
jgi:hypothetical protein